MYLLGGNDYLWAVCLFHQERRLQSCKMRSSWELPIELHNLEVRDNYCNYCEQVLLEMFSLFLYHNVEEVLSSKLYFVLLVFIINYVQI